MIARSIICGCVILMMALVAGEPVDCFAREGKKPAKSDSEAAITRCKAQLDKSPEKPELWRKLGVVCFEADRLDEALAAFTKANALDPNDATSIVYRGMIHEEKDQFDQAIGLYRSFLTFSKGDRLTQEVKYRLRWIEDRQLQQLVKEAITNEKNVDVADIVRNSIAVVRFDAVAQSSQLKSLGRGLAELIYNDLSYVPDLKLVERLELARLQQELEMNQSQFSDKLNAPRIGKIVGAAKIITGKVTETEGGGISIDCGIIDVGPGLAEYPGKQQGKTTDFFTMQQKLVLSIIDKLGYPITPAIKNQIDKSPTESFLALLAYSRGLDYADRGLYPLAEAEFKAALKEDPRFALAQQSLDRFSGLSNYDGNLKPITQISGLATSQESTREKKEGNMGEIIHRLQDATRGTAIEEDAPYTTPQTSRGKVVVTGGTERR